MELFFQEVEYVRFHNIENYTRFNSPCHIWKYLDKKGQEIYLTSK